MDKKESSKTVHSELSERDPLFEAAARKFIADGYVTISMFMFNNGIGYNRGKRIVEQLEAAGVVGPKRGRKPREVLVDLSTLEAMLKTN